MTMEVKMGDLADLDEYLEHLCAAQRFRHSGSLAFCN